MSNVHDRMRREDRYHQKKLRSTLERLQTACNSWGLKLTYTVEELPKVKRKRGFLQCFKGEAYCSVCKNTVLIYRLFKEIQPWHKITDYQCGRCGHEWRNVDNTYD
jgi:hypothetical protein